MPTLSLYAIISMIRSGTDNVATDLQRLSASDLLKTLSKQVYLPSLRLRNT